MVRERASAGRWGRLKELAIDLVRRATTEHASPREIGWSVGIGVFCACTPLLGLHMWIALALTTLLRLNRLWALLGSRASIGPLFPGIAFCEIEIAHLLRTGYWANLAPRDAMAHGREMLSDWIVGTGIIGPALGAAAGLFAYAWAIRRRDRLGDPAEAAAVLNPRTPDGPLPPSSGSQR